MPWFVIQRGIELLLGLTLREAFHDCDGINSILIAFNAMNHLEQIGTLTVMVLLVTSLGNVAYQLFTSIREMRNRYITSSRPAAPEVSSAEVSDG